MNIVFLQFSIYSPVPNSLSSSLKRQIVWGISWNSDILESCSHSPGKSRVYLSCHLVMVEGNQDTGNPEAWQGSETSCWGQSRPQFFPLTRSWGSWLSKFTASPNSLGFYSSGLLRVWGRTAWAVGHPYRCRELSSTHSLVQWPHVFVHSCLHSRLGMRYSDMRQAQHLPTLNCLLSCFLYPVFTPKGRITENRWKFLSPALPLTSMLPAEPSGQHQTLLALWIWGSGRWGKWHNALISEGHRNAHCPED